jgi:hypothetical protein
MNSLTFGKRGAKLHEHSWKGARFALSPFSSNLNLDPKRNLSKILTSLEVLFLKTNTNAHTKTAHPKLNIQAKTDPDTAGSVKPPNPTFRPSILCNQSPSHLHHLSIIQSTQLNLPPAPNMAFFLNNCTRQTPKALLMRRSTSGLESPVPLSLLLGSRDCTSNYDD